MSSDKHIRHGKGSVRPYLYGHLDLADFLVHVFGAREIERVDMGGGFHVESEIGDSVVVLEIGPLPPGVEPTRASIYVYVPDVDAAYHRALARGASSVAPPEDKPYGERGAGVKDTFGNIWWIGTYTGSHP